MSVDCYERVKLTATLTTSSPLHIGSGDFADDDNKKQNVGQLCLDHKNQPYIPGSSLRGYLRRQLQIIGCDADTLVRLLGEASNKDTGNAGCLYVYDAFVGHEAQLSTRSRTAIDPITATAKQNHLYSQKEVLPGAKFTLLIVANRIKPTELQVLVKAVNAFNQTLAPGLGKGQSLQQGQFTLSDIHLTGITTQAFAGWLTGDAHTPLMQAADYTEKLEPDSEQSTVGVIHLLLHLIPTAPLLVNDPEKVQAAEQKKQIELEASGKKDEKSLSRDAAKLIFSDKNGHLLVPASTLKGWLRGHARKVLLTISAGQNYSAINQLLDGLFGSKEKRGLLKVSDAVSTEKARTHYQVFNAVDRFTGGVADGALYDAEFAWASYLKFDLILDEAIKTQSHLCALLALVLRDACEGDCRLGWGKNKGFGQLVMSTQTEAEPWESMQERLRKDISVSDEDVDALWQHFQLESNTEASV